MKKILLGRFIYSAITMLMLLISHLGLVENGWAGLSFFDASDSSTTDYETFAAMKASKTPTSDDIVDGNNLTYRYWDARALDGTPGHPIIIQDAILDGASTDSYGIDITNSDYIYLKNITTQNCVNRGFYSGTAAVTGVYLDDLVTVSTGHSGFNLINSSGVVANRLSAYSNTANGFNMSGTSGTWTDLLADGCPTGIRFLGGTNVLTGATVTGATAAGLTLSTMDGFIGSYININSPSATSDSAISLMAATNTTISHFDIVGGYGAGVSVTSTSTNAKFYDGHVTNSTADGFSVINSTGAEFYRCIANGVGRTTNADWGDAFTSHVGCTGEIFAFNLSRNNLNTSHAHIDTSAGAIYHHTGVNDGDPTNFNRAMLYLPGTGEWIVKNSVFVNLNGYSIAQCGAAPAITADYNAYISNLAAPFKINGTAGKTWSEWITAVGNETHSIFIYKNGSDYEVYYGSAPTTKAATLTYCPVASSGKLVNRSDNPLIDAGDRISEINDVNQTDLASNKMSGMPDIGCYEVVPTRPKTILRIGRQ